MTSAETHTPTPASTHDLPELWGTSQVAAYLGVAPETVRAWRAAGEGPPPTRVGRQWRYELPALKAWLESGRQRCAHGQPRV